MEATQLRGLIEAKLNPRKATFAAAGVFTGIPWQTLLDAFLAVVADGALSIDDAPVLTGVMQKLFLEYVVPYDIPILGPGWEERSEKFTHDVIIPAVVENALRLMPS